MSARASAYKHPIFLDYVKLCALHALAFDYKHIVFDGKLIITYTHIHAQHIYIYMNTYKYILTNIYIHIYSNHQRA